MGLTQDLKTAGVSAAVGMATYRDIDLLVPILVRHASPEVSRAIAREMYLTGELVALVRYAAQWVGDEVEREDILLRLADIMTPPNLTPEAPDAN